MEIKPEDIVYDEEAKIHRANLGEEDAMSLVGHWLNQGYSTLYSAFANKRLHLMNTNEKKRLKKCTSAALGATDHARCVAMAIDITKDRKTRPKDERKLVLYNKKIKAMKPQHLKYRDQVISSHNSNIHRRPLKNADWIGSFGVARVKRAERHYKVVQRENYELKTKYDEESPFAEVGRRLTKTVRLLKNKTEDETWDQTMSKLKAKAKQTKMHEKFRRTVGRMADINGILDDDDDPLGPSEDMLPSFDNLPNGQAKRMLQDASNFAREGVKLTLMLAKQNTSDFNRKNLRINSPRFLAITPEENPENTVTLDI
ncbi:hypothetical protein L596_026765 [Steinernema carpocapsae]|uniref:Uncharacterized protein n=1 Tax=Steinernema carpocapsae TaxID=34508 RepID=A0A4U5M2B2_STECR|nr:hypothetical protein L596_026765 [Steinernema carpocapsae]